MRLIPALVLPLILSAGCTDEGSTNLGTPPTTLDAESALADTVIAGDRSDPLMVRVGDALGEAIEGVPVRFTIAQGEGRVAPTLGVTASDGVAEAIYESASTPENALIIASIPSAENVPSVEFSIVSEAADSVSLSVVEGDDQTAEVASQLPIPFTVVARSPGGSPAGGITIAWRITRGSGASAVLSADTTVTDAQGRSQVLLTLGRQATEYGVQAFAARGLRSDTAGFRATATTDFTGNIRVDSIGPLPLLTGTEAAVFGRGFSPIIAENDVRIEGESAEVLEAAGDRLTVRVPDFGGRCLPSRQVGVRVLAAGDASNGSLVRLDPAEGLLDLDVGEVRTIEGADTECIQIGASSGAREFRLAVGSASEAAGEAFPVQWLSRAAADLTDARLATSVVQRPLVPGQQAAIAAARPDERLRQTALAALRSERARPGRPLRANRIGSAGSTVGDTVEFFFAIGDDLSISCSNTSQVIRGVVREKRDNIRLVEDLDVPAGGFQASDWAALADELETVGFATDTAFFGSPPDLDGSGDVVALFTSRVNRLSPPGAGAIGGFFLPLDLAESGRGGGGAPPPNGELCPASNEAELLYFVVPDPDGELGNTITRPQALRNARGLFPHELQHLINAGRRVFDPDGGGFTATEEVWLDEGLSQMAEELAGLSAAGLQQLADYGYDQVTSDRTQVDAFNAYHLTNFFNLSIFMFDPAASPSLSSTDPGGVGGLRMRGFSWFFLRWLADQSGDPRTFLRRVATGGPRADRGIANLEVATGRPWRELLSEFVATLATDDAGVDGLGARFRVLTWDFRSVLAGLSQNQSAGSRFPLAFPLAVTTLPTETRRFEFDVRASTARYFSLAQGLDARGIALTLSGANGTALDEDMEPQVTIVRTR